jgi:hypothetical protein
MVAASIKTLRQFSKGEPAGTDELAHLLTEMSHMSDRAAIIIIASYVEDGLEAVLRRQMRELDAETDSQLFGGDGAISSFSKKTKLAYALNLIDKTTKNRIDDLREMRNACAHTKRYIGLEVPELANVCKRFLESAHFKPQVDTPEMLRATLLAECSYIKKVIVDGPEKAEELLRTALEFSQRRALEKANSAENPA